MIKLNLPVESAWIRSPGLYTRGSAFSGDELLREGKLDQHFAGIDSAEAFVAAVQSLNGFFAVVRQTKDHVFVAVDRVRSIPLFYGHLDGSLFVSDNADWVLQQVGDGSTRDELAKAEFLLTGYVTGADTLHPNVKQLQAGECLVATKTQSNISIEVARYYRFKRITDDPIITEGLLDEFENVIRSSIQRLVEWASGRTIVIPLSGGYDSRLILTYLKRFRYPNIITFTYGRPGNAEAKISEEVARQLGVPWHFVEYSNALWREWFNSPECRKYFEYAHQLTSLPHIQDWPAIWSLQREGHLPKDAIFAPGHTGDFIAGSHTIQSLAGLHSVEQNTVAAAVLARHYRLWSPKEVRIPEADWEARIKRRMPMSTVSRLTSFEAVSLADEWNWQERQAKFIVNSVRAYEFWGYDWWLPLWDLEMMLFWCRVPLQARLGASLYTEFVISAYAKEANVPVSRARQTEKDTPLGRFRQVVRRSPFFRAARTLYDQRKKYTQYDQHPLAWYGILSRSQFNDMYTGRQGINSFLAKYLIDGYKF